MRGKGIVVEVASRKKIIVMTSQGEFLKIPFDKPVWVGQEIQFDKRPTPKLWHWSLAAAMILAVVGSVTLVPEMFFVPGGTKAAFYVTLDINPSIEVAVNRQQRVVFARGLNTEGEDLLERIRILGKPLRKAVQMIGEQAAEEGYLVQGQNEVIITITTNEEENVDLEDVEESDFESKTFTIQHEIEDVIVDTLTTVYRANVRVWQVPKSVRTAAEEAGMSPGRYMAVQVDREDHAEEVPTPQPGRVTAVFERNGETRVLEFQMPRPVLAPATWTREPTSPTASTMHFSVNSRSVKGEVERENETK